MEKENLQRVKTVKLRGVWSYGLLIPNKENHLIDYDCASGLGIKHYEPEENIYGDQKRIFNLGETAKAPELLSLPNKYDLEHFQKYNRLIPQNTSLMLLEKVDGSFCCLVFTNGQFHVKSRNNWKREFPDTSNLTVEYFVSVGKTEEEAKELVDKINSKDKKQCSFWKGLRQNEPLQKFLIDNPGTFVMAELFGNTNRIKYQIPEINRLSVFDIWKDGQFFDCPKTLELANTNEIEHVPVLEQSHAFTENSVEYIVNLAEGKTQIKGAKLGTIREGVVVKPRSEIYDYKVGRLALKVHSPSFLRI